MHTYTSEANEYCIITVAPTDSMYAKCNARIAEENLTPGNIILMAKVLVQKGLEDNNTNIKKFVEANPNPATILTTKEKDGTYLFVIAISKRAGEQAIEYYRANYESATLDDEDITQKVYADYNLIFDFDTIDDLLKLAKSKRLNYEYNVYRTDYGYTVFLHREYEVDYDEETQEVNDYSKTKKLEQDIYAFGEYASNVNYPESVYEYYYFKEHYKPMCKLSELALL